MRLHPSLLTCVFAILLLCFYWLVFPSSSYTEYVYFFAFGIIPIVYLPAHAWWRRRERKFGQKRNIKAFVVATITAGIIYAILNIGAFISLISHWGISRWMLTLLLPYWRDFLLFLALVLLGFFQFGKAQRIADRAKNARQKKIENNVFQISFIFISILTTWQLRFLLEEEYGFIFLTLEVAILVMLYLMLRKVSKKYFVNKRVGV